MIKQQVVWAVLAVLILLVPEGRAQQSGLPPGYPFFTVNGGPAIAGVGDVNGDNVPDMLMGDKMVSGATGSVMYQLGFTVRVAATLSDLDNDNVNEVLVADDMALTNYTGMAKVISGATGTVVITLTGNAQYDQFGNAVANVGDINGDGKSDFAIGAPQGQPNSGVVYVYSGANFGLLRTITAQQPVRTLGKALVGLGDIDNDGASDFAVGAPFSNAGSGLVFVYSGATGSVITSLSGNTGERLGMSLAVLDYANNGVKDLAVGVIGYPPNSYSNWIGAVFIYTTNSWQVVQSFTGSIPIGGFGSAVVNAGDTNGDGVDDLLAGEPAMIGSSTPGGRAHLFSGLDGTLLHRWDSWNSHGGFGAIVAGVGDVNGDFFDDIAVSQPNAFGNFQGVVKVYGLMGYRTFSASPTPQGESLQLFVVPEGPAQSVYVKVRNGTPNSQGLVGMDNLGLPNISPLQIQGGNTVYVDLTATQYPLIPFTTDQNGEWVTPVFSLASTSFAGNSLIIQAAQANPSGAPQYLTSNAVILSFGL